MGYKNIYGNKRQIDELKNKELKDVNLVGVNTIEQAIAHIINL